MNGWTWPHSSLTDAADLAADDPMHDISLDLAVRGRAGVRVDNNLGEFDVNWDVLRVSGHRGACASRAHTDCPRGVA